MPYDSEKRFLDELAYISNKHGLYLEADSLGVRVKSMKEKEYLTKYGVEEESLRDFGVTVITPWTLPL